MGPAPRRIRAAAWRAAPWFLVSSSLALPATPAGGDSRIRTSVYDADEVYRLQGYAGYQVDLEFERGETFVGLGAGDVESLTFSSQDNHLFLKPRATDVETNLTILTSRRTYHFQYRASARRPDPDSQEVIYVLRFVYPSLPADHTLESLERPLSEAADTRARNLDYAYCGSPALKPEAAWDDGVQTHVKFGARQELPALFVRNDDGSESLVNFSVEAAELIVHRVARQFVVRRGNLQGCIVNQRFAGTGDALRSGTIAPAVQRVTREGVP
jgi:type IV secretion system protein VirB9